jgi:hypothetical protein
MFTPSPFKTHSLHLVYYLALHSPMLWKMVLLTFSKSSQNIWHVEVYTFISKHPNEA